MSKAFVHGIKFEADRDDAMTLWFSDERRAAEKLAPELKSSVGVHDDRANQIWPTVREAVLAEMTATHPGLRPHFWWVNDCPRGESRRLVSGAGSAASPAVAFGIPYCWQGYSAADPPCFESQAEFLRRHDLLSAEEIARADFSPERIEDRDVWVLFSDVVYFTKHARFVCVW